MYSLKAQTHHKVVVLGGLGCKFWPALSDPDTNLDIPGVLALLCFAHLAHDPGKHNILELKCVDNKRKPSEIACSLKQVM